jgi:hypothetical protein
MAVLIAAVILVGLICLADLLLTFGVIRRLREQAEQIGGSRHGLMPLIAWLAVVGCLSMVIPAARGGALLAADQ